MADPTPATDQITARADLGNDDAAKWSLTGGLAKVAMVPRHASRISVGCEGWGIKRAKVMSYTIGCDKRREPLPTNLDALRKVAFSFAPPVLAVLRMCSCPEIVPSIIKTVVVPMVDFWGLLSSGHLPYNPGGGVGDCIQRDLNARASLRSNDAARHLPRAHGVPSKVFPGSAKVVRRPRVPFKRATFFVVRKALQEVIAKWERFRFHTKVYSFPTLSAQGFLAW